MRRLPQLLAAACALLLASCADRNDGIPAELREIMRAGRAIALPPLHPDFAELSALLLTPNLSAETDARIAEIVMRIDPAGSLTHQRQVVDARRLQEFLSHEEIIEEINFLFDLLRYGYGAYQYFGGDDVFLPLRDSMLERLAGMDDPMQVSSYLFDFLVPSLSGTIADNHFWIHTSGFAAPSYVALMSEDFVLRRAGNDLVREFLGETYRLVETTLRDGTPVEGVLPTLTRDGEFAFAFGRFAPLADPLARDLIAIFECASTGIRHSQEVRLARPGDYAPQASEPQANAPASRVLLPTREVDGVTVMENRTMAVTVSAFGSAVREFFLAGRDIRENPLVVLDLRGHNGGFTRLGEEWIRGYTGQLPLGELSFVMHSLRSATTMRRLEANALSASEIRDEPAWIQGSTFDYGAALELLPNAGLVIVLMDNHLFSAGELFIGYLRQLENALFVGTNTRGTLVTTGIARTRLPHSGLDMYFGMTLNLRPDLSRFEGVGFLPDLWVPPQESLERVLAFIERYGLNR